MKKIKYILSALIIALIGVFCISKFSNKKVNADNLDYEYEDLDSGSFNLTNQYYEFPFQNFSKTDIYYIKLKINATFTNSVPCIIKFYDTKTSNVYNIVKSFYFTRNEKEFTIFFNLLNFGSSLETNYRLYCYGISSSYPIDYEIGYIYNNSYNVIFDSFGNALINNVLYYSNENYLEYGDNKFTNGYYEGYQVGLDTFTQTENLFVDGALGTYSCRGYKNGVETVLTSQQYYLGYTPGGLVLNLNLLDFDRVLLSFEFISNSSLYEIGISQGGSSFYSSPLNLSINEYNGSYWHRYLPEPVSVSNMEFNIPKSSNGYMSNDIKIYAYGYTDWNFLIKQAYDNGVASQQQTINELRQEVENGFSLFTPVTALLNTPLFYIGDKPFTLGVVLMFSLGLTAVFIFLKIFK